MAVLNKEFVDVYSIIFSSVTDLEKTKQFVKEWFDKYHDSYYESFHVFYNLKAEKFTIYPKFGETVFVAYLDMSLYQFMPTFQMVVDLKNIDILNLAFRKILLKRIDASKADLLKIHEFNKYSKLTLDITVCKNNGLKTDYETTGFILPENVRYATLVSELDKFYVSNSHMIEIEKLKDSHIYAEFWQSDYFKKFRKDYRNSIKEKFLRCQSFINSLISIDRLSPQTVTFLLKEIETDIGEENFNASLNALNIDDQINIMFALKRGELYY